MKLAVCNRKSQINREKLFGESFKSSKNNRIGCEFPMSRLNTRTLKEFKEQILKFVTISR